MAVTTTLSSIEELRSRLLDKLLFDRYSAMSALGFIVSPPAIDALATGLSHDSAVFSELILLVLSLPTKLTESICDKR